MGPVTLIGKKLLLEIQDERKGFKAVKHRLKDQAFMCRQRGSRRWGWETAPTAALPGWMPAQQTPSTRVEAAPGTQTASNGSSSCGHTLRQSIWSWHTVLPHNMVREWRGHLSAGGWQRTGLLQKGLWWPPFPCAQKATYAQQTHAYCLEVAKNINKGRGTKFGKDSTEKCCLPELSRVLKMNSGGKPFQMQMVVWSN